MSEDRHDEPDDQQVKPPPEAQPARPAVEDLDVPEEQGNAVTGGANFLKFKNV